MTATTRESLAAIYECIETMHSATSLPDAADSLLSQIENGFRRLEPVHAQNFVTFISEELPFFQSCARFHERFLALAVFLQDSDLLASKVAGIAALAKYWVTTTGVTPQFRDFVNLMFKLTRNTEEVPHLRSIASSCLYEIRSRRLDAFHLSEDDVFRAANNILCPNAFPQLSLLVSGKTPRIEDLYAKRWWSMSPFESMNFLPFCRSNCPAIPSDPLLLHSAMTNGSVSKDAALSMLSSPLMPFGVSSVVMSFTNQFDFDGTELFSPFDSRDQVAAKCVLMPSTLASVVDNPTLADFVNKAPDSPLVGSVFGMAARFGSQDLFDFFRKFFADTPQFDRQWVKLYEGKAAPTQRTIRYLLAEYPARSATAQILLSSEDKLPTLAVITELMDETLIPLLGQFAGGGN
jgi:hypothetical protein